MALFNTPSTPSPDTQRPDSVQKAQCAQWHRELVDEFVATTTTNICIRIKELDRIIQRNEYLSAKPTKFQPDWDPLLRRITVSVQPIIEEVTLVQLGQCRTVPDSKRNYKKVARNRLNRNKPKFLGNLVFGPIVFDALFDFCGAHFGANKMAVFVSLIGDVLSRTAVVRFEQTRAQPLIPSNSLVLDNAFKTGCDLLLSQYHLDGEWRRCRGKKATAKTVADALRQCLPELARRCALNLYPPPITLTVTVDTAMDTAPSNGTESVHRPQSDSGHSGHSAPSEALRGQQPPHLDAVPLSARNVYPSSTPFTPSPFGQREHSWPPNGGTVRPAAVQRRSSCSVLPEFNGIRWEPHEFKGDAVAASSVPDPFAVHSADTVFSANTTGTVTLENPMGSVLGDQSFPDQLRFDEMDSFYNLGDFAMSPAMPPFCDGVEGATLSVDAVPFPNDDSTDTRFLNTQ